MTRTTAAVALAFLAGTPCTLLADDLTPAPWRFGPGTTFQHWDFSAGPAGGAPDGPGINLFNPYGTPMLTPSGATWTPAFGGRNDVWFLGGTAALSFDVPNTNNTANQKELWLQITFQSPAAGNPPGSTVASPGGPFVMIGTPTYIPLPGNWFHELTRWSQIGCPPFERVSVFSAIPGAGIAIDQVVIDTRCFPIPAPGAGALLAIGTVVAVRRRR